MTEFKLKEGMLLGTASAATQIEGGRLDSSWIDWAERGRVKDGSSPARANDHYHRWAQDTRLMADMGMEIYRMGVEWARLEPEQGQFDEDAINRYKEEIAALKDFGIKPLVTLHHFTNPMWFERLGGFEKKENIPVFLSFVEKLVTSFGGLVNEYITINEPNVYATNSFFFGEWPPGEKSFFKAVNVMSVMCACHLESYKLIHRVRSGLGFEDTRVSFANHLRVFAPTNPNSLKDRTVCGLMERFFQGSLTKAMCTGKYAWPIKRLCGLAPGQYCDFIAINYYTRSTVSSFADGVRAGAPTNDLGWEIYPPGIVECARWHYDIIQKPIYITENGTCDNGDRFRGRYVCEHLKELCQSDLPITRYYHWCFCDNFEWAEGETSRFGLVHVDYETQQRQIKQSGYFFSEIIKHKGVTRQLYEKYAAGQTYNNEEEQA